MVSSNESNDSRLTSFFSEEYLSLQRYVRSKIEDTTEREAEDIVQDVALRIFSRSNDAAQINNVAGFVYNAIRNRIIDLMRSKKERNYASDDIDGKWQEFADLFYGEADNSYGTGLQNALKEAIEKLKPEYRNIILAVDFEGYTYREISQETGIAQGTLMSRRHRALSILAKNLEQKRKNI
ncbi:RNA polymerase sigma factor [Flagellimonas allohymeniacidonis]|uniref:RNA polymerase sigma factor n=2 Tax=Flagellimonas allohymeniacidonis TaxID=2517819 RepID=A0A4Q8QCT5_9FLAO|nr:RNA polymerase sigma factor [Allomuricauda hymeniacidonis]